jgi:adenylosuccinate synthase
MNSFNAIVLGAGFGDEGKGSQVNFLAKKSKKPLVIRFSGGHQVGHTVVVNGKRHVFSNFGSGTIHGAPTYWSEYCTFNPIGIQREAKDLESQGVVPRLYLDANAMVTTPFDMLRNKQLDKSNKHGSVGVGFGQTIQRTEDHYTLFARDLRFPAIRDAKLDIIRRWYGYQNTEKTIEVMDEFRAACDYVVKTHEVINGLHALQDYEWIFEGSQGIMLDMDYGFFPHVTRSNTTAKNALEIIKKYRPDSYIRTFYMTRAYQTRHGNGPMTNQNLDNDFITDNPLETNRSDGFQGEFRKSPLDLDMLKYAIECDTYHNPKSKRILVVTCLDQVPERIPVTINNGEPVEVEWKQISTYINPIMDSWGVWSEEGYKYPWELEKQEINE